MLVVELNVHIHNSLTTHTVCFFRCCCCYYFFCCHCRRSFSIYLSAIYFSITLVYFRLLVNWFTVCELCWSCSPILYRVARAEATAIALQAELLFASLLTVFLRSFHTLMSFHTDYSSLIT